MHTPRKSHTYRTPSETFRLRSSLQSWSSQAFITINKKHFLFSNLVKHVLLIKDYLHATFEVSKFSRFWAIPVEKNGQNFFEWVKKKMYFIHTQRTQKGEGILLIQETSMEVFHPKVNVLWSYEGRNKRDHYRHCSAFLNTVAVSSTAVTHCTCVFSILQGLICSDVFSRLKKGRFLIWLQYHLTECHLTLPQELTPCQKIYGHFTSH